MYLEYTCETISLSKWERLMQGARKASYKKLVRLVKKEIPSLYESLCLNLYNPWENDCAQTKTHYVLVHSAIEYFIKK